MAYNRTDARIAEVKRGLEACRQAIMDVLEGGQSYTVSGGISINHPPLAELRKQESEFLRELISLQMTVKGILHQRTAPDFAGDNSTVIPNI